MLLSCLVPFFPTTLYPGEKSFEQRWDRTRFASSASEHAIDYATASRAIVGLLYTWMSNLVRYFLGFRQNRILVKEKNPNREKRRECCWPTIASDYSIITSIQIFLPDRLPSFLAFLLISSEWLEQSSLRKKWKRFTSPAYKISKKLKPTLTQLNLT